MTTTNRAFIKAYRQDEPQPVPSSPALPSAARPVVAQPAHAPAAERSALYGPRSAATTSGEKRPLSSFIAGAGIGRLHSAPAEADVLRAGTTVASFQWPTVCRALSRQCREELGQIADLLVTHAVAGRSLVGVVGLKSGFGATTIALCLAARLADRRRRVILVDGNFRKPHLATLLDAEPTAGWQDVLKHGAPLSDAVIRATDDHLDLLALGPKIASDPLKLVAGLQAVVTAGVLRHAYEHVLVDAGAFLDAASQPILLELVRNMGVDAAIAVTGPRALVARDIDALADQLGRSGCEFLGTIENRTVKPQSA